MWQEVVAKNKISRYSVLPKESTPCWGQILVLLLGPPLIVAPVWKDALLPLVATLLCWQYMAPLLETADPCWPALSNNQSKLCA
jgi:hypothetical protein